MVGAVVLDDPTQLELLAELDRRRIDGVGNGAGAERRSEHALDVGIGPELGRRVHDALGELLELFVLGDEVGLTVELDERATGGGDEALRSGPLGPLADVLRTLDAQELDSLVEVALGLVESPLAIHHSGAGQFPEPFDISRTGGHFRRYSLSGRSYQVMGELARTEPGRPTPRGVIRGDRADTN